MNVPRHLIQSCRLIHAIMESSFPVHIAWKDYSRYSYLKTFFDIAFVPVQFGASNLDGVTVDHRSPATRVGSIARPLIFPRSIPYRCRSMWSDDRRSVFHFSGLMTDSRKRSLAAVAAEAPGAVDIRESTRGRKWPIKAWDERYYRSLASTRYALCPDGDFVWTYRFFEAILCGAVPVVESIAPLYEGFYYETMGDLPDPNRYPHREVLDNYVKAIELLTLDKEQLDTEIAQLVGFGPPKDRRTA